MMPTPKPTLDNITEEELNQALLNFIKVLASQKKIEKDHQNDPDFFLYNNILQKSIAIKYTVYCEENPEK